MTDKEKKELHTETIINHRQYVGEMCDLMGIHDLGEAHDLSKFTPEEFEIYKYVTGNGSPHDKARAELGYSPSWAFHRNHNKHHYDYWLDNRDCTPNGDGTFTMVVVPIKIPYEYIIEMFCDMVGASKAYRKEKFSVHEPLKYWKDQCENKRAMHKDSEILLVRLLTKLDESNNEPDFIAWYNTNKEDLMKKYEKGTLK